MWGYIMKKTAYSDRLFGNNIDELSREEIVCRFRRFLEEDYDTVELWETGTPHQRMRVRAIKAISKIDIEKPKKVDVDLSKKSPRELATYVVDTIEMSQNGDHRDMVDMQRSFYEGSLHDLSEGEYIEYLEHLAEEIDSKWSGIYSGLIWLFFGEDRETARIHASRLTKGYWEKKTN